MTYSIGDVLEQLNGEFPDITVSKIRFLESQGLLAPMRTSAGFRMFSQVDISKLKWILSHQRDRFLPLKVIKEYLLKLDDSDFEEGNSPSFDFETSGTLPLNGKSTKLVEDYESNKSDQKGTATRPHLKAVKENDDNTSSTISTLVRKIANNEDKSKSENLNRMQESPFSKDSIITRNNNRKSEEPKMHPIRVAQGYDNHRERLDIQELRGATSSLKADSKSSDKLKSADKILSLEKMTIVTGLSGPILKELAKYSILDSSGSGNSMVFDKSQIEIAITASKILKLGIEPRLLKTYVLFAGREIEYLDHIVQDDLRKHNPESSKIAKEKAIEYIRQSAQLKELLLLRAYANEEK